MERGILIAETHHGFVCANAGVDASNVEPGWVTVLPRDPDASAARIAAALGPGVGVVISDTFGRPWREGVVNVALGVAGLRPLLDRPVDHVLPTHGAPAGRAALRRACAAAGR
jgi:coenzyme F420-0:L-glutamate ligase/coenzyme F420-1:gamma-L-glutamate ligase